MKNTEYLDPMGRDELEDWNQAKVWVPMLVALGVIFIVSPVLALGDNPYWWVASGIGGASAGIFWFFACVIYVTSIPTSIHKVNGHWEMNR